MHANPTPAHVPEQTPEQPSVLSHVRRCKGWAVLDGIIVQCPELARIGGAHGRHHSRQCYARTRSWKEHGFTLKDELRIRCQEPSCGNRLDCDNESGYCITHRCAANRPSWQPKLCPAPNCGSPLRSDNTNGYCTKHTHLSEKRRDQNKAWFALNAPRISERSRVKYQATQAKLAKADEAEQQLQEAESKVAQLREQLEFAGLFRAELQQQLEVADKEVHRHQAALQGSDAKLALAVDEEIPQFERLFSLAEVKANPRILLRNAWTHPDFSLDMISAAGGAVESRKPAEDWPKIAAISFVATRDHYVRDSVRRGYSRYHSL